MAATQSQSGSQSGLDGVVAAWTRLSGVDGEAGELIIAGYAVEDLAPCTTFEETAYLIWHDALPSALQLTTFSAALAARREISQVALQVLQAAAERNASAMDALRMAAGTLSMDVAEKTETPDTEALGILARLPTLVAAYWRLLGGQEPIPPRIDLSHTANYHYMLTGEAPGGAWTHALDTYLNTIVDHGLNASTFAARVIISTRSDLVSAIVGALGALKGPLHGGAPAPALDMVFEIGTRERAEPHLRAMLERGERLMGFGHRIYKVRDPRADVLAAAANRFYAEEGDRALYDLALHVEATALRLLEEYKPGRRLQTNVEFYTALLLHGLDLPTALFTPTFALGRAAGWIAHCFEQQRLDRIIRPQSVYVGERDRTWTPLDRR